MSLCSLRGLLLVAGSREADASSLCIRQHQGFP